MSPDPAVRVLLLCSGLDHARRGFESFARECFHELRGEPELEIALVKGSGPAAPQERSVPALTRDTRLLRALGRASGREPFLFEQAAFALSVLPVIARRRPDVVYFSEWYTGRALALMRRAGLLPSVPLVLCNGTMAAEGFGHLDRVQELTPAALQTVLARGGDPARHVMLPLGFALPAHFEPVTAEERRGLRERLELPPERRIVLSTAALNRHHKRLDYLIEEVARLPEPRPFLLLAGQPEPETPGVRRLARELLGDGQYSIRTVDQETVGSLLRASDVFVLASLGEGLPRALIEALAQGLPCLTHDYGVTRFALGEHGRYADFSRPGALATLLGSAVDGGPDAQRGRHASAYERFSWDRLRPRYVDLLREVAGQERARQSASA